MPFIGEGPSERQDVMPAWSTSPPYHPAGVYVAQWPVAQTIRVDGRWRINSDSLQRPIATRWLLRLKLIHYPFFPALNNPEVRWLWFWYDLTMVAGQTFTFATGSDADGINVTGSGQWFADLGMGLGSGFRWVLTTQTVVDPDAVRTLSLPDNSSRMEFSSILPQVFNLPESDPAQDDPVYGPYYQAVDVDAWPLSECFPTDEWQIQPPPQEATVIGALFQYTGPDLSINPELAIPWNDTVWTNAGAILDPGDPARLVIPPGFQYARFSANFDRTASINSFHTFLRKNGTNFPGQPVMLQKPDPSTILRNNISSGWLQVVATDFFEVWAGSPSGLLTGATNKTWVAIELGNP